MRCGTKRRQSVWKHPGFLLILAFTACRITPHGEWNALECSDDLDNDGDGLVDCDDPDCWAFACKRPRPTPIDAGADASSTTPSDAAPFDADPPDAMTPPPPHEPDSGPMSMEDSGEPDRSCTSDQSLCKADEECVAGVCKPIDIRGDYTLQILSASVPDRNPGGICYDADNSVCALGHCDTCKPDPFVVVKKNNVVTVDMTLPRTNTTKPTWTEPGFPVTIADNDTLQFMVRDADLLLSSEIFTCSPDLRQLPTGMLHCGPLPGSTIDPGSGNVFEVVARVTKLP
jgi:hypothetical protein